MSFEDYFLKCPFFELQKNRFKLDQFHYQANLRPRCKKNMELNLSWIELITI